MGSEVPKQFLPVGGRPVLMLTIERFRAYSAELGIVVVLPREQQAYWRDLCGEYGFTVAHTVADGGATRFLSSRSGLSAIPADACGLVGFHDGVRPFVPCPVIDACYAKARATGAAIPVLPVTDTLRHRSADGRWHNVRRSEYCAVQTPQVFDIALARRAFAQPPSDAFTDDASAVEALGHEVATVDGARENIKLTTPYDLEVASCFSPKISSTCRA